MLYVGWCGDDIIVAGRKMHNAILGCCKANLHKNTSETRLLAPYPDIFAIGGSGKSDVPGFPEDSVSPGAIALEDETYTKDFTAAM